MNIKAHRSGLLCLLLLALFLLAGASQGQETRKQLEESISELRYEEQYLEEYRAELQDDLRKIATTDESGRARYVLMTGTGSGGPFWTFVPREQYERLIAIGVLIGEMTPQRAALDIEETVGKTRVFPQAARARLRETEQMLARVRRGLSALQAQLARLKGSDGSNRSRAEASGRGSLPSAPRADSASQFTVEHNTVRSSDQHKRFYLPSPNHELCQDACAKSFWCRSYIYIKPESDRQSQCILSREPGDTSRPHECCISGVKKQPS